MVQVLHLMSTDPDLQSERTAAAIRRASGDEVAVSTRTIGRGGVYRNVVHAALSLRFGRGIPFDVVHAFDSPALVAACAAPSPLVFSPSEAPALVPGWWRAAMVYRNGTAIATTAAMQRRLIRQGIPAPRCDVNPPAIELDFPPQERELALRAELGLSPRDRVVLAPGESTRASGHLLALHAVSILHVLDERHRLLIWGRGKAVSRLRRLARLLRQPRLLVVAEPRLGRRIDFECLTRVADMALVTSRLAAPMPVGTCMAAGLPIIAAGPAAGELLEDGRTAGLASSLAPRLIAQRLLHALENPDTAAAWAHAAQREAARRFDPRQNVTRFLSLYRRLAGVSPKGAAVGLAATSPAPPKSATPTARATC
jgi:glycosyltransferase involved in cell wall biosynthesis